MLFTFFLSSAQIELDTPWMKELKDNSFSSLTFDDIISAGDAYWETRDKNAKGSGYKPFKRWEAQWENYVNSDGFLPTTQDLWNVWEQKKSQSQNRTASQNSLSDQSSWFSLGPTDFINRSTNYLNLGRVNCVNIDPNNSDIMYVGAPAGGIWKSTDAGVTYIPLVDHLPQIGVSGIAIDPNNSNIIYIATGDDDAGDSYSVGVWKSTDAGTSWLQTGLNPSNNPGTNRTSEIYINPNDSNVLWVATNTGVYMTTNAGNTWTLSQSGNFRDLKVKPSNPNIVYASTNSQFYRSTNGGNSFNLITTGLPSTAGRMYMDVTQANPNYVYLVASTAGQDYQGIYRSTNSGLSFTQMDNTRDIFDGVSQAWYDLAISASNTNENEIYVGVLNIWKSTNGGNSFSQVNSWTTRNDSYTHADIHFIRDFENGLFVGSDGGVFKSTDNGSSFEDLTVGLSITQFYRISVSKQDSEKIAGGAQDNGGFGFSNQWASYHGGDGMEGVIDPNNDNLYYGFLQNGTTLYVSNNSGQPGGTNGYSSPTSGNWITPLSINNDSEVFAGYSSLYQFSSGNWTEVSPSFGTNIDVLELDPINSDNIYVGLNSTIQRSLDHGLTFTNLYNFPSNITSIEINNNDNNILYVTTSGGSGKVWKSLNQGLSFTDITGSLPNVVKNIIKHQTNTIDNVLYLGTSLGVYRYNDNVNNWTEFDNNLPNSSVRDLSINIPDNNITAATYGRGAFRSELPSSQLATNDIQLVGVENPADSQINCGSILPQLKVKNNGQNNITSIDISYILDENEEISIYWVGNIESEQFEFIDLNLIDVEVGEHEFSVTTTITGDYFSSNNSAEITFYANNEGSVQEINTFENPEDELIIINEGRSTWELGVPTGTLLNSAASPDNVYATNLDGNHKYDVKGYLV
jgi:ligand-binding sensor domain-containing protein